MRVSAWIPCGIGDHAGDFDRPSQLKVTRDLAQRILKREDALTGLQNCKFGNICHGNLDLFRAFANGAEDRMVCGVTRGGVKLVRGDLFDRDRHSDDSSDSSDSSDDDSDGSC